MKTKIFNIIRSIFKLPFFENWLREIVKGKSANSFFSKLVPNNYQYAKNSLREFEYKGIRLKLDIHDYLAHFIYFGFEDPSHATLMNLIKKDDVILDIGTNYGTTILQFAKQTGNRGQVYGFEPDFINFSVCMENIKLNSFANLQVENIGLGSKEGSFFLVVDNESNRGMNRIGNNSKGKNSHEVKIIRLDDWVNQKGIEIINLIKIDVEGFEMEVLRGGEQSLRKYHPLLFIELDDTNLVQQNSSAKELVEFLNQLNYTIYHSETGKQIFGTDSFRDCHYDIICK